MEMIDVEFFGVFVIIGIFGGEIPSHGRRRKGISKGETKGAMVGTEDNETAGYVRGSFPSSSPFKVFTATVV